MGVCFVLSFVLSLPNPLGKKILELVRASSVEKLLGHQTPRPLDWIHLSLPCSGGDYPTAGHGGLQPLSEWPQDPHHWENLSLARSLGQPMEKTHTIITWVFNCNLFRATSSDTSQDTWTIDTEDRSP